MVLVPKTFLTCTAPFHPPWVNSYFFAFEAQLTDFYHLSIDATALPNSKKCDSRHIADAGQDLPFTGSSRDSTAAHASIVIAISTLTTNASFLTAVCNGLADPAVTGLSFSFAGNPDQFFLLPDCFFEALSSTLSEVSLRNIIVLGNNSFPNPWSRLTSSSLTSFYVTNCRFVDVTGNIVGPDWNTFLPGLPVLRSFQLMDMSIGGVTLPNELPNTITTFSVQRSDLSGSIPASFIVPLGSSTVSSFMLMISRTLLEGSIPNNFLSGLPQSSISTLSIVLSNNRLTGTIDPSSFAGTWSALSQLTLDLSGNTLSGAVQNVLGGMTVSDGTLTGVTIKLSGNLLVGAFMPTDWFAGFASGLTSLVLDLNSNSLTGTIPPTFLSTFGFSNLRDLQLILSSNSLTGDLPSLVGLPLTSRDLLISLRTNQLQGTIPTDFFLPVPWTNITNFQFSAAQNQLVGDLPPRLYVDAPTPMLSNVRVDFGNIPGLAGTIPSSFWPSLIQSTDEPSLVYTTFSFVLAASGVTGALNLPDFSARSQPMGLRLLFSANSLQSISLAPGVESSLEWLFIDDNYALTGTLPAALFNTSQSRLKQLHARNTLISGIMPDFGLLQPPLETLDLSSTSIDFCSGTRSAWNFGPSDCRLLMTNASQCAILYPSCSVTLTPTEPSSTPQENPSVSPVAPASPLSPAPSGCPLATRPSPDFVCVGTVWTFRGTLNTTVLTIPGGATQTIIEGNITSSTVIITGLGSSVLIYGCAANLSLVTVELTPAELEQIGSKGRTQTLLWANSSQCGDSSLGVVMVSAHVSGKTCRKASVKTVQSGGTLSGVFVVSSSGCNVWWIVLVSVVCGVLIIAAVIAVVVTILRKRLFNAESERLVKAAKQ